MDFNKLFEIFSEANSNMEKANKPLPTKKQLEEEIYLNNNPEVDDKDRSLTAEDQLEDIDEEAYDCVRDPECDRDTIDFWG